MSDVKETMDILVAAKAMAVAVHDALADGSIGFGDLGKFMGVLPYINEGAAGAAKVKDELKALDADGVKEVVGALVDVIYAVQFGEVSKS